MVHWCDGGGNAGPQVALLVGLLLLLLLQRHGQQPGPGRGHQRARARVPAHRGRPRPRPAHAGQVLQTAISSILSVAESHPPAGPARRRCRGPPRCPWPRCRGWWAGGRSSPRCPPTWTPGPSPPSTPWTVSWRRCRWRTSRCCNILMNIKY